MTEREEDRVFEEYQKAREPILDPKRLTELEMRLIELLTQHGYAVCWEILHQRRLDVVNAGLMRIMTSLPKFRGDAKFSTYAHRIFINECKRVAVKEGLRQKREVPLEDISEPTAPDALGDKELFEKVKHLLSDEDWDFAYQKLNGFDDEIGENFGLSRTGVRVRWHRIRKKLRGLLRST